MERRVDTLQVSRLLEQYDDNVLKQMMRHAGQEWDLSTGDARAHAISRMTSYICNYLL
jgi:hypothetical protein